ncbi:hypothetical protein [Tengunoibacter tsumagoiensis]|uniref:Uncharacterized protein n=1 Tax=Tengunoibacter tsumagoiensis TaxID=2014871 RepID=A0A402A6G7_9CHLR|nr:hypothetical protein [Tengunoibacter tsumagoiensis]GCE14737.1 hypothetical protein KTT_45960 [Tengunoibacter tsumagoiensis]
MDDADIVSNLEEPEKIFQSDDIVKICQTLVHLALHDSDWKKVEGYCLELLEHPDAGVRMVAATCIGHLARIHQQLDLDLVLPALYRHQSDTGKYVAGNVNNALDDIEIFMKVPVKHDPSMVRNRPPEEDSEEEEEDEERRLLTPEEVEQAFRSGEALKIERTLMNLAFLDPDWRRTEGYCLQFLEHSDSSVRGVAAQCISQIIYNQHHIDVEPARRALLSHQTDASKYVVRMVRNALIAIDHFEEKSKETSSTEESQMKHPIDQNEAGMKETGMNEIDITPKNGQLALNNSVSIQGNKEHRIGIDPEVGELVEFEKGEGGKFQGRVRTWLQLTEPMRTALIDSGIITEQGDIIQRDKRGNITGYGKNVISSL